MVRLYVATHVSPILHMFAKPHTYRALDAWQDNSLTIYKVTDTVQFEGQLDNKKDPFELKSDSLVFILILFNCL